VITRVHLGRSMRSECAIMPRIFHLIESFFVGNVRSKKEIFLLQIMSVVCSLIDWKTEADVSWQAEVQEERDVATSRHSVSRYCHHRHSSLGKFMWQI
jgi:hypothetical protein